MGAQQHGYAACCRIAIQYRVPPDGCATVHLCTSSLQCQGSHKDKGPPPPPPRGGGGWFQMCRFQPAASPIISLLMGACCLYNGFASLCASSTWLATRTRRDMAGWGAPGTPRRGGGGGGGGFQSSFSCRVYLVYHPLSIRRMMPKCICLMTFTDVGQMMLAFQHALIFCT